MNKIDLHRGAIQDRLDEMRQTARWNAYMEVHIWYDLALQIYPSVIDLVAQDTKSEEFYE